MKTYSELLKEINSLPLGNVYQKTINGNIYYYHQYFLNGIRYSEIVKEDEVEKLKEDINHRKELVKLLKQYDSNNHHLALSRNMSELTGEVMSGNIAVAKFEKGVLVDINEDLCPLSIKRTRRLEKFLSLRTIDMSRTNARLLKKALNIHNEDDDKISLFVYALSVNDNYWFKPKHSKLKYNDIHFDNDQFFDLSLRGDTSFFPMETKLTPEITTVGSFEKGWRYIDNIWYLYKVGNNKQFFSELFASRFASLIGVDTIQYEMDGNYIRCQNFASIYNFEPFAALYDDNEDYDYIFNNLYKINPSLAKDYIKLLFFDAVINNVDRHNENAGFLRDRDSGKIVSLAPNFDNNLSLISNSDILNINVKKDTFINYFVDFIKNNDEAILLFKKIEFVDIDEQQIKTIIDNLPIKIEDEDNLIKALIIRYNYLKNIV